MDQNELAARLASLPIPEIRYFPTVGSTNDLAAEWAARGAPEFSLVVADEQTAGRGRAGRQWHTPPGAALAFSLVLRPQDQPNLDIPRLTALGSLAVCTALIDDYALPAQIKWPNDVLVNGKKLCGVLVEAAWQAGSIKYAVLGTGVNVAAAAVPQGVSLAFPATDIESELGQPVTRLELIGQVLEKLLLWNARLGSPEFLSAWKLHLAWMNMPVEVSIGSGAVFTGEIAGLGEHGALQLQLNNQQVVEIEFGEVQLRPR
jgi:BirA family biotin operon repressor/biotin-[acetyl-CoA-carboxylase] ligase